MKENNKNKEKDNRKIKPSALIFALVLFGLLVYICLSVYAYAFVGKKSSADEISRYVFLPAIIINRTNFITVGEIKDNLTSIKRFYEKQDFSKFGLRVDFSTADGKKRLKIRERELINKMIEDKAVEILAKQRGISISKKMVDASVNRKIKEYGDEKGVENNLRKLYGWTLEDFKEKVVRPSLYREQLRKWIDNNDGAEKRTSAIKKAKKAQSMLKQGMPFDEVAQKIGENPGSGHFGWFKTDFLVKGLRNVIPNMQKGEVSKTVETKLGFHIIRINDIKDDNGEKIYDISQIFFPKLTLAEWLTLKIEKMNVKVLLRGYVWDAKTGMVEFKDKKMREFEQKELSQKNRDASLLAL